jgi:hypothetical protein
MKLVTAIAILFIPLTPRTVPLAVRMD